MLATIDFRSSCLPICCLNRWKIKMKNKCKFACFYGSVTSSKRHIGGVWEPGTVVCWPEWDYCPARVQYHITPLGDWHRSVLYKPVAANTKCHSYEHIGFQRLSNSVQICSLIKLEIWPVWFDFRLWWNVWHRAASPCESPECERWCDRCGKRDHIPLTFVLHVNTRTAVNCPGSR
jgi:hypothetical protein